MLEPGHSDNIRPNTSGPILENSSSARPILKPAYPPVTGEKTPDPLERY